MYALVESRENGGLYRSDDAGASWRLVNLEQRIYGRGNDFACVRADPNNKDIVYVANISTYRSTDGGQTFQGPFFISTVFDVNYPRSGSPASPATNRLDCFNRGQGNRSVLTNSCFRVNSYGNISADPRGGAFADDLYAVIDDNRNGQRVSSNTDVFLFKSTDGGQTWIGPTRVNDDPSRQPTLAEGTRDCGRVAGRICPATALNFGNDQWFPWVDVSDQGDVNVVFYDRRLDTDSTAGEWPESRAAPNGRPGNYLVWNFGAQCAITSTATVTQASTSIPAAASQCLGDQSLPVTRTIDPTSRATGSVRPVNSTG